MPISSDQTSHSQNQSNSTILFSSAGGRSRLPFGDVFKPRDVRPRLRSAIVSPPFTICIQVRVCKSRELRVRDQFVRYHSTPITEASVLEVQLRWGAHSKETYSCMDPYDVLTWSGPFLHVHLEQHQSATADSRMFAIPTFASSTAARACVTVVIDL